MTAASPWEAAHAAQDWGKWPPLAFIRFLHWRFGQVPSRSAVRLLELGCGRGPQLRAAATEGFWRCYGIDISPSARAKALVHRSRIITGDVRDERLWGCRGLLAPGEVDGIIDVACTQHLSGSDAAEIIRKARRWLKPGGWFFSMTASTQDTNPRQVDMIRRVDRRDLDALFAGYRIEVSHKRSDRSDGTVIASWIVEAECV